ncbi:MAG TPA: hypothetical protein PKK94_25930, partial [Leptospiraceae bacterium]|nr:hypothetical protein [Leptospiraceae bacterium]
NGRAVVRRPADAARDDDSEDVPEETMWFEYAFRAARGTGRRAPTEVERALCSNILQFRPW